MTPGGEEGDALRLGLAARQHAYKMTFRGPLAKEVLMDLAWFCRANESTFDPDARLHAVAEGRREVWLRLMSHLNMTTDDLWLLLSGRG